MDDDTNVQGPDGDMGEYVEDARGYDPEESEDSVVDKVKNALGGDSDEPDDDDLVQTGDGNVDPDDEGLI